MSSPISTPRYTSTSSTNALLAADIDLSERFSVPPTRAIRKPIVAKHQPRVTDGVKHPVTRRFLGEQAAS